MKIILQILLSSILASLFFVFISFADDHGKIIKERKSLFKQNYSHAKKMSAEIAKGNNDKVIELSEKMSANYDKLIDLFPISLTFSSPNLFKVGKYKLFWSIIS